MTAEAEPEVPTTGPLSRTCPRCKAAPGQPCITTNTKRPAKGTHAPRLTQHGTPRTGRHLTLTPQLTQHITTLLANGTTLRTAADTAGISENTLFRWIALGQSDHPDHRVFREFREAVQIARAQGNAAMAANIVEAGYERVKSRKPVLNPVTGNQAVGPDGEPLEEVVYEWDWKAHAWVLERAFAAEWGKRATLEITGGEDLGSAAAAQVSAQVRSAADRVFAAIQEAKAAGELMPVEADIVEGEVVDGGGVPT